MFDWIVGKKLDQIGRLADPDRAFVVALGTRIKSELPHRFSPHWKVLAGSLTGISCLLVGTGSYAYASDNVLPGSPLYSIREGLEQAETTIAPTPAIRAAVTVRHMQRRIHEQEVMNVKKIPANERQMQRFADAMEVTIDETSRLDDTEKQGLDTETARLEEKFAKAVRVSKDQEPTTKAKERLETILDRQTTRLQERVKKLEEARREHFKTLLDRRSQAATGTSEDHSDSKEREQSRD